MFPAARQTTDPGRVEVLRKSAFSDGDAFWRQSGAGIKSTACRDQEDGRYHAA